MDADLLKNVPGGPELLAWFGYAPSLHDSEVLRVTLDRVDNGSCTLEVHGFVPTGEVDMDGYFVLDRHAVITFVISDLRKIELEGFNFQNALMGIEITRTADGLFCLDLDPANGLGGVVEGSRLEVSFEPGVPPGIYQEREKIRTTGVASSLT